MCVMVDKLSAWGEYASQFLGRVKFIPSIPRWICSLKAVNIQRVTDTQNRESAVYQYIILQLSVVAILMHRCSNDCGAE